MPAFDAASRTAQGGTSATVTWPHTCSGSNRVLIVGTCTNGPSVNSVTYNGAAMTLINSRQESTTGYLTTMWYLVNPDLGTNTVQVNLSEARACEMRAVSWTNAHQITPIGSSNGVSSVGATATTLSISSEPSNNWVVIDAIGWNQNAHPASAIAGTGQSRRGSAAEGLFARLEMSSQSGSHPEAMSWSFTSATNFGFVAVPIQHQAASPPPGPPPPGTPIQFASTTGTQNPAVGTSIVVTVPGDVLNGDLLFAVIAWSTATETLDVIPAGWTTIRQTTNGGANDISMSTFYRTADSEPASYTWRMTGTGVQNSGVMWRITGQHGTAPFDGDGVATGSGGKPVAPSINSPHNGNLIAVLIATNSNESGFGYTMEQGGWTNRNTHLSSGSCRFGGWSKNQAGAGGTGAVTVQAASIIAEDPWIAMAVAFRAVDAPVSENRLDGFCVFPDDVGPYAEFAWPIGFSGFLNKDAPAPHLDPVQPFPHFDLPFELQDVNPIESYDFIFAQRNVPLPPPGPPTPTPSPTPQPIPTPAAGAPGRVNPRISLPPQTALDEAQWKRQAAAWMAEANQGHLSNTGIVTLAPNQTTTFVVDDRVSAGSFIGFMPTTANSAAELRRGTMFVSQQGKQNFTITHSNNNETDRTFVYSILG